MHRREKKPGLLSGRNLIGLFIVVIMVFSVLGYMFGRNESEDVFEYNGYKFQKINNMLTAKVGNMRLTFFSDPRLVEYINISPAAVSQLKNSKMIYITYNNSGIIREDVALAHYSIAEAVWDSLNIYLAEALIQENEYNLPVITCLNATQSVPVIYFRYSNETGFTYDNNCLVANVRTRNEVFILVDRILFSLYGIME